MSTLNEAKKHYAKVFAIYNATKNSIKQSPEVIELQRKLLLEAQVNVLQKWLEIFNNSLSRQQQ
ncbi:MAG: hypothetical protein CVU11_14005 [Bacteroidetes bacterium HGW-Bacteroidetes-6]|jgi:hypothetical protein|nr:MAG: hypothetical protein CVU11_14005 [Bacteroidetes bacterium HGW-Bacteroidetes-6]